MTDNHDEGSQEIVTRYRAPKGNKFWMARSKHGRDKIFSTPEAMWEACCEYFQWCEENPLWEDKAAQYQGVAVDVSVAKMRAMTIEGLCMHFGANSKYLAQFEQTLDVSTEEGRGFSHVISDARDVIRRQKFEGAAADLLNPNIIARDLGLKDSSAIEHSGTVDINKMSDDELNIKLMALINESGNS
jgi:hypothetical protein